MLRGVTKAKEVSQYYQLLQKMLGEFCDEVVPIRYSSKKGVGGIEESSYSRRHNMWWFFSGKENQYWNAFGFNKPIPYRATTGRCQINMPHSGINRSIAGAFAVDDYRNIYLLHDGKIGGGNKGKGQKDFIKWFDGELVFVDFNGTKRPFYIVADFSLGNIVNQIHSFVEQVYQFKSLPLGQSKFQSKQDRFLDNEETINRSPYGLPEREIYPNCLHAKVMRALKNQLIERHLYPKRTKRIDLILHDTEFNVNAIFEIKAKLTSQSLFTAVGQLIIYGLHYKEARKYLVVDSTIDPVIAEDLLSFGIDCIRYELKDDSVLFDFSGKVFVPVSV